MKKPIYASLAAVLALCQILTAVPCIPAYAADKTLTVEAARKMALADNDTYTGFQNKLTLAKVQYDQSVKSLRLKEKNQRTFRWSPLLSFHFPEKPDLADEYSYTYKPLEMQSKIDKLEHQLNDCVYGIYEKVELEFIKVYVLQERISFNEDRVKTYETTTAKNRVRLLLGQANKSDIDAMEKKVKTLNNTLASDKRKYESEKEKLSDLVGVDVSLSYQFASPFADADLPRDQLDQLISTTLDQDDSFYQTKVDTANGLLALNINYNLMKNHYGSKMNLIDSFVTQARNGKKLDSAAFKLRYNELLNKVDEPWQGKKKILFIRFPKEWLKGAIDGVRYVEDEPYALYEAAIEYQSLLKEEESAKKELTSTVKDYYENYVSARNTSRSLEDDEKSKKAELKKASLSNMMGKMTYEEYGAVQEEYEDLQMDKLDAQAAYSEILYSLNRLTCGAISSYIRSSSTSLSQASGGQSYVVEDEGDGVYYYIHSLVSGNLFEFGLSVPDDFEPEITDYELWVDSVQIGDRTPADQSIRHLALDIQNVNRAFVRLYNGDTFVDDCDFDAQTYSGKLSVKSYRVETREGKNVASYETDTTASGLFRLKIKPQAGEAIEYFNIKTEDGNYLLSDAKIPVSQKFQYLAMAKSSLDSLIISFYDKDQKLLYEGTFNTSDLTIQKKE